jgi:hypothetical protein
MATVTQIRQGIATNLGTISGLRVSAIVPDNPNPPVAFIEPQGVSYDTTFGRGMDEFDFDVTVLVQRMTDTRTGQNLLDGYIQSSGSQSVKQAIELDRKLGGLVQDCRVTGLSSYGVATYGETTYFAAVFAVKVYSN